MLLGEEELTAEARALGDDIRRAWTAFATHGDPGWPAYRADRRLTRLWDVEPSTAPYPEELSRRIWDGSDPGPADLL